MAAVEEPPAPVADSGDADGDGARIVRASYAVFRDYGLVEPDVTDAVRFVRSTLHGFTDLERRARVLDPAPVDATFARVVDALDAALTHWPDRRGARRPRHRLDVDGASLPYEVRGSGPLLVLLGAPVVRSFWAPVADVLAGDHAVVTYDPRGFGAATGATGDLSPARLAADVVALVEQLDVGPARLVGCSGGAVTGIELARTRPDLVAGLVAHEPPLTTLLPERDELAAVVAGVREALHTRGVAAAQARLAALVAGDPAPDDPSPGAPPPEDDRDVVAFLGDLLVPTLTHDPDLTGVVGMTVGIGTTSTGELPHRCAVALAARTGSPLAVFPGGHLGAAEHPHAFADRIREVLA